MERLSNTYIVDHDEEGSTKKGTEPCTGPDTPIIGNTRGHSSLLLLPYLHGHEASDQEAEQDK